MFNGLIQDIRYAIRALSRSPGFTFVAVLILALGIGANTAIFSIVNGCFFAPPPHVAEPDRLVRANVASESSYGWWSHPNYAFYREHSRSFRGLCAYEPDGMVLTAAFGDNQQSVDAWYVSDNYFDVLGIQDFVGRGFRPEEGQAPGAHAVAVISYPFWQRSFGGEREAVGSLLKLNGHLFTVVGVAPEQFRGVSPVEPAPDVWVPLMMQPLLTPSSADWLHRVEDQNIVWLQVLGRLEPQVSVESAQAEVDALTTALQEEFPASKFATDLGIELSPVFEYAPSLRDQLLTLTRMLSAVVGLVLLVASANIAILLLARASARSRDIGIQVALGAKRGRIVRQLLIESLLLAAAGGTAGYLLAFWTADLAVRSFPFSFGMSFNPDARVLAYTMVLAVVAVVIFGVAPALLTSRTDVSTLVKSRDAGLSRLPLRSALVVGQIGLSIVLVLGAVQFVRSLRNAESVDLGFETENRLLVSVNLTNHGYSHEELRAFIVEALERLETSPGIVRATTTLFTPFRGRWGSSIRGEGTADIEEERKETSFNSVSPGYFEIMGIPLMAGRDFSARDDADAPLVAVMNEAAARMMWSDEDGLGRAFMRGDDRVTVIGIAKNANYHELGEQPKPLVFVSALQPVATFTGRVSFLLQTATEPMSAARSVQNELHSIDPDIAFSSVQTMEDCVERVLGKYRIGATVVSFFGALALVLATVGLYGVLSYLVLRRTRSIGIQMALGATEGRVTRSVITQGLKLCLFGIVLGLPAALAVARFFEGFLYGIEPRDPVTFVTVPMALLVVACVACLLPAYRASRINPVDALREE